MKTYIIHTSHAHDRKIHMSKQLQSKNLDVEFITDGDKNELTQTIIDTYFGGELDSICNMSSCAYKHILTYHKIIDRQDNIALILEDDIFLDSDFTERVAAIIKEISFYQYRNFVVSLEDSSLTFVKKSVYEKGRELYPQQAGRMTGAYLVDKEGVKTMLKEIELNKCNLPIDWFHNHCISVGLINMYWAYHPMASQGSINGKIKPLINKPSHAHGLWRVLSFKGQHFYKRILYALR